MTELLNTGMRIRHFRILCGMTPKQNLLCQIANMLGISPSALAVPRIKNGDELRCLLIALEDECGIKFSPQSDNAKAIYESYGKGAKNDENL